MLGIVRAEDDVATMNDTEREMWYVEPGLLGGYVDTYEIVVCGHDARRYQTLSITLVSACSDERIVLETCYTGIGYAALWTPA